MTKRAKKVVIFSFGSIVVIILALVLWNGITNRPPAVKPVPIQEIVEARDQAAAYLVNHQNKNGSFVYVLHPDRKVKKRSYNLLRHAGSIYSLAMAYRQAPSPALEKTMIKAAEYLLEKIAHLDASPEAAAVWGKGKKGEPRKMAKLGGAGLALIALSEVEKIAPGTTPKATLHGLGQFMRLMQKPAGDFHSKYADSGPYGEWVSLYYPGEAILGLLMLDDIYPDSRWRDTVDKGLLFFARERKGKDNTPPDHWMLIALGKYFVKNRNISPKTRELHIGHSRQIVQYILKEQITNPSRRAFGAFDNAGRTTPATTRLEGLLASIRLFDEKKDKELIARMDAAIHRGMHFVLKSQIQSGELKGGFPRVGGPLPVPKSEKQRDFLRRANEVRIDYVQHALSAMVGYIDRFTPNNP
jgi:hypothetical protein